MDAIFSVSELTDRLHKTLEARFPFVWVRGEISNLTLAASGHIYFSLKDKFAQLNCVWFSYAQKKSAGNFDPLTGEVYKEPKPDIRGLLRNGLEVLCAGSIGIYAQKGQYQLQVDLAEPAGIGALALAFEALKNKLAQKGYFDPSIKKPISKNPSKIALITSSKGAAIHDFFKVGTNRGLSSSIRLFDVLVQGEGAAEKISNAFVLANAQNWADVIVLIRGGGSIEDLQAFNDERVADAIFNSTLPVLTGIGHEVDVSIADLVADVRGATPSHAAQLLWSSRNEMWQRLDELDLSLRRSMDKIIRSKDADLRRQDDSLFRSSPWKKLETLESKFEKLNQLLQKNMSDLLQVKNRQLEIFTRTVGRIDNLHAFLAMNEKKLTEYEKSAAYALEQQISSAQEKLKFRTFNIETRTVAFLERLVSKYMELGGKLIGLDPLSPLQKGYALVFDGKRLVRSIKDCATGNNLNIKFKDGNLIVRVENKDEKV